MSPTPRPDDGGLVLTIARLSGFIASGGLSNGDRAALKRMHFDQPPPLAFYKMAVHYLPPGWESSTGLKDWVTIVSGMALMSPSIHRPDRSLGRVLAEVNYSESRLERLLAARGDVRRTLVLRTVRLMAAKLVSCNWSDVAGLILLRDPDKVEAINRRIARDFYFNQLER